MIYDCIIIGAGAAGLFCAASMEKKINGLILEKTPRTGTKLLMSGSGQTLVLAQGITHVMGRWYALLAGVLGVIGSFVTGSNMSSNILFTDVQVNAAADLGVSSSPLLAAQTAGASAGSMISPSKIILGTAAGGVPGEEGTVLRFTLLTAAILTLVTGVICWIIL